MKNNSFFTEKKAFCTLLIFLTALTAFGCVSNVDKKTAEDNAVSFVRGYTRFGVKDAATNTSVEPNDVSITIDSGVLQNNNWLFLVHVEANYNNATKKADVPVSVDAKTGKVIEYNRVKVEQK